MTVFLNFRTIIVIFQIFVIILTSQMKKAQGNSLGLFDPFQLFKEPDLFIT